MAVCDRGTNACVLPYEPCMPAVRAIRAMVQFAPFARAGGRAPPDGLAILDVSHHVRGHQRLRVRGPFRYAEPVGFEPTRGDPIGLAGQRLNHAANVSCTLHKTYVRSSATRAISLLMS